MSQNATSPITSDSKMSAKVSTFITILSLFCTFICVTHAGLIDLIPSQLRCDPTHPNSPQCWFSKANLRASLIGQDHVAEELVSMIRMIDPKRAKPVAFHAAGDTGTGKSLTISLLSKSIFKKPAQATLIISGSHYRSDDSKNRIKLGEELADQVAQQLKKCPTSLIVIDDVQYVHATTLTSLIAFMDEKGEVMWKKELITTRHAIFGYVSDFAIEGFTANKSLEELQDIVRTESKIIWSEDTKMEMLVFNVFPFRYLSDKDLAEILRAKMDIEIAGTAQFPYVDKIQCDEYSVAWMVQQAKQKYPNTNARSVQRWVDAYLKSRLGKFVVSLEPYTHHEIYIHAKDEQLSFGAKSLRRQQPESIEGKNEL
ncbi:torsin A [Planoprotostelium fungivorum]|uniref:Torsin A n=1 Tax=Planoprotostelium fungivorum TaxID=1890364 RepID=A0A2P6N3F0_9EUKA|nr:torsin A [Planoprotostelium fungivorum]